MWMMRELTWSDMLCVNGGPYSSSELLALYSQVSYIEDLLEEERSDVLIGRWPQKVWQGLWSLAEQCIEQNRKRRPLATQVSIY